MPHIRLQKLIAQAGVCSRRAAEELIREGKVRVNGERARLGAKADPAQDEITVRGKPLGKAEKKEVYLFHKPKDVITTLADTHGRPCLGDYIKEHHARLFPVGRLDSDATGLLILTNDGRLAQKIHHPSNEIYKTYLVQVTGRINPKGLKKMAQGIRLDDRLTAPAKVRLVRRDQKKATLSIMIFEGRNHQVKRMCKRVGMFVQELKRIKVGPFELGEIQPGQMRRATPQEMAELFEMLKRPKPSDRAKGNRPSKSTPRRR